MRLSQKPGKNFLITTVSIHGIFELVKIPKNKSQMTNKYQ